MLFVSHNMGAVKSLCKRGIILENGFVKYDGYVDDAVEYYLKTDELNIGAPLIDNLKVLSTEVQIDKISVNGLSVNQISLEFPNRTLYIEVRGKALNKLRVGIECLLFDSNDTLLGKFAPTLHDKETDLIQPGEFYIDEVVNLPMNMTNGDYFVQIEITHPKVEYLAVIPKGLKLSTYNYLSKQGIPFDYKLFGFLYL